MCGGLALWRWRDTMALEDVAHRLVTDRQAEVGQGADDPVIAPGAIFLRHTHDQGLQLRVDHGAAWGLTLRGAVKLLGHKRTVPAKNRAGLDDGGHFLGGLLTEFLANLGQSFTLAITEPYTTFDLVSQHAIFGDEVLIA